MRKAKLMVQFATVTTKELGVPTSVLLFLPDFQNFANFPRQEKVLSLFQVFQTQWEPRRRTQKRTSQTGSEPPGEAAHLARGRQCQVAHTTDAEKALLPIYVLF